MIRELKTLETIASEGTFAAAAGRLNITQAAVSAQMQRLEGELNCAIFERQGRAARLTQRGHEILRQARHILQAYDSLYTSSCSAVDLQLTIGAIASVQRRKLPKVLGAFLNEHPRCKIRIVPGLSIDLVDQVDRGKLDLAIIIKPPFSLPGDLQWTLLNEEPYRLIMPTRTADTDWKKAIHDNHFIRYDRSSFGGRQVSRFLKQFKITTNDVCELDELEAIIELVECGVGVAIVPEQSLYQWPKSIRALPLPDTNFTRAIGLIHPNLNRLEVPVRDLIAELVKNHPTPPKTNQ